ncbi:MAG: hypothetical protein ACLPKI_22230 [Streptosporangiaceae bacterium]
MSEPTLDTIAAEFPGWHTWRGIAGLFYASLRDASPPIVVRGEDPLDLCDQIRAVEGQRDQYGRLPPGLASRLSARTWAAPSTRKS